MDDDAITCVCLTRWPERAGMLQDALRAFHQQTHAAKRLVVVNDGAILRSDDPRVVIANLTEKRTIGEKRNLGLRTATTPWVATWDDDDFMLPEHLATLLSEARRQGVAWMRSARAWLSDARLRVVDQTNDQLHCTTLVRRTAALQAGGYPDVDYAEDASLATRLRMVLGMAPGSGPRCEPLTYVHRRHRANVSRGHSTAGLDEQARRGLLARQWWTSGELERVNARLSGLMRTEAPSLVYPLDGARVAPRPVFLERPQRMPFHVDALIDARWGARPDLVRAARDAQCLRAVHAVAHAESLWKAIRERSSGREPGAWLIIPATTEDLRSDHVCRLVEAVRAGDLSLARGLADSGELVNKVGPWLPAGPSALRVVRRTVIDRVPPVLRGDAWFGMALDEGARRSGERVESIVLDGMPVAGEPLADRALRAWEAARHVRSVAW